MREMPDIRDQLARMERRQEAVIQAVSGLADVMQVNTAMLADLMAWLKEPPKSDLTDLVKALVTKLDVVLAAVLEVPEKVADALDDKG